MTQNLFSVMSYQIPLVREDVAHTVQIKDIRNLLYLFLFNKNAKVNESSGCINACRRPST